MKKISLEKIAEKLDGNLWVKEGLKRVYLERGFNTKKISTTTYVECINSHLTVRCFVNCPSQHINWIKDQQRSIINSVDKEIEEVIKQENAILIDYELSKEGNHYSVLVKKDSQSKEEWYTEDEFNDQFGDFPDCVFGGYLKAEVSKINEGLVEECKNNNNDSSQKSES